MDHSREPEIEVQLDHRFAFLAEGEVMTVLGATRGAVAVLGANLVRCPPHPPSSSNGFVGGDASARGPEWAYEVKLDGYRAQAIHGARLRLLSRHGKDFSSQFRETYRALASAVPADSVIDGELVALDVHGRPSFQALQNSATSGAPVVFFAFDILMLAGRDVRMLPLAERQQRILAAEGVHLEREILEAISRPGFEAAEQRLAHTRWNMSCISTCKPTPCTPYMTRLQS